MNRETPIRWTEGKKLVILFLMGGILLLLHTRLPVNLNDDAVFSAYWKEPLWDVLKGRFEQWSSRIVIEAALIPLAAYPVIWRILNAGIVLLFVWNTADLFGMKRGQSLQAQCIFFALIWSVPMDSLCSAGWIATTVNYLWPLSLGTVALRPAKHFFLGERCPAWEYAVCPLCLVFAANMEQVCAILLGTYLLCGAYLLWNRRKPSGFYFAILGMIVLSLCLILFCPGNRRRYGIEIQNWFPEFETLGFGQKLLWGWIGTIQHYVERARFLSMLLPGVLLALLWERRKERKGWMLLPALAGFFPYLYWLLIPLWEYLQGQLRLTRVIKLLWVFVYNIWPPGVSPYDPCEVFFQTAAFLALAGCMALTVYFVHGRSRETLLQLLILGAGLLSRVILGFTPTFFASGSRTALYCSAAILIVVLRNFQIYLSSGAGKTGRILLCSYFAVNIVLNQF